MTVEKVGKKKIIKLKKKEKGRMKGWERIKKRTKEKTRKNGERKKGRK